MTLDSTMGVMLFLRAATIRYTNQAHNQNREHQCDGTANDQLHLCNILNELMIEMQQIALFKYLHIFPPHLIL